MYMDLNEQPNLVVQANCQLFTIIGKNFRLLINKYDISRNDWNSSINRLYKNMYLYSTQHCTSVATLSRN